MSPRSSQKVPDPLTQEPGLQLNEHACTGWVGGRGSGGNKDYEDMTGIKGKGREMQAPSTKAPRGQEVHRD